MSSYSVDRLWIVPTLMLVVLVLERGRFDTSPVGLAVLGAGAIAGVAFGAWRAAVSISGVEVGARKIRMDGARWLILVFVALLVVKVALAHWLPPELHRLTDALLVMNVAAAVVLRLQCYRAFVRARTATATVTA